MAVDASPSNWLGAGYSLGTNQAIFNTSNHGTPCLSEVTNAQANASTGDVRQLIMGILDKLYAKYLTTVAGTDRPTKMTMFRSASENENGQIVRTFQISFITDESTPQQVDSET